MSSGLTNFLLIFSIWIHGQAENSSPLTPTRVTTRIATEFNRSMETKAGWIGGDAVYTVPISEDKLVWLFGDSLFGKVKDGKRVDSVMVNNAIAISGRDPLNNNLVFISAENSKGKKVSFFQPETNKGYYWPLAGWADQGKFSLFLSQMENTGSGGVFGFRQMGLQLAEIDIEKKGPDSWKPKYSNVPFYSRNSGKEIGWGSSVLQDGDWVYVYGYHDSPGKGIGNRQLVISRFPRGLPKDYSKWEFRTREGWSANSDQAEPFLRGISTEFSVTRLEKMDRYLLVYTENGLGEKILGRLASTPFGPWSESFVIYECQEMKTDRKLFTYSAKSHPWFEGNGEVLISYCVNSWDFGRLFQDEKVYRPRFIKAKLEFPPK